MQCFHSKGGRVFMINTCCFNYSCLEWDITPETTFFSTSGIMQNFTEI